MHYQINSKSFLFASDSTHEYGDKMPTHETACCITIAFWETRKIVGMWFEIILKAMWIAKPWRSFVVFCWSVSYADYFLMFVFHMIFYSVQHDTAFLAVVAFPPNFVLIFYFFSIGLICFMAIQNISYPGIDFIWGSFFKQDKICMARAISFLIFDVFPHLNMVCLTHFERVECGD